MRGVAPNSVLRSILSTNLFQKFHRSTLVSVRFSHRRPLGGQAPASSYHYVSSRPFWMYHQLYRTHRPPNHRICRLSSTHVASVDNGVTDNGVSSATSVTIKINDYSDRELKTYDVSATGFQSFLEQNPKPQWAACRWIYINSLDREVIQCLGRHKNLHPLAIEDVLDVHTPTKVDWYEDHCFMEMTLQKLVEFRPMERSSQRRSPLGIEEQHSSRFRPLSPGNFGMSVEQVSAFLTTDDTIITIFEHSGSDIYEAVHKRLQSSQTVFRSANDSSLLLQAVIDEIVDLSLPIGRAIGEEFRELELAVLTKPALSQSEQLYVLRSGCTTLMDTIIPVAGLLRALREHSRINATPTQPHGAIEQRPVPHSHPSTTFISPMTSVYLADVQDHIEMLSQSLHRSVRSAEYLTSLIFSTIAARQNESVQQLTVVSVFFLPLTFLTGYFGMNFDPMPVVNDHSDMFFWYIATPVMACLAILTRIAWRRSWGSVPRRSLQQRAMNKRQ